MAVGALDKWILWANGIVTRYAHYVKSVALWLTLSIIPGILIPLSVYPIVGIVTGAYLKALSTAKYLHKPVCIHLSKEYSILTSFKYFTAKNMSREQTDIFMEERKWHYRGWFIAKVTGVSMTS